MLFKSSRTQADRLLDSKNDITLSSLQRAAAMVGCRFMIQLVYGEVIKQRIARPGQGKSRGYRTIILFRRGAKAFFVYGFSKSRRANITEEEKKQFKEAAKYVLSLAEEQLWELLERGDFVEVKSK